MLLPSFPDHCLRRSRRMRSLPVLCAIAAMVVVSEQKTISAQEDVITRSKRGIYKFLTDDHIAEEMKAVAILNVREDC